MPRTTLTKKTAPGPYADITANGADLAMTAADVANKNQFRAGHEDIIFAHNTGASPHTITITSAPDEYGRSEDVAAYSLGAGEYAVFGPLKPHGWQQTDGYIYLEADHAEIKFGIVAL